MIYHTKSGNCGNLCEDIAGKLKEKYDVQTNEVKDIKPDEISKNPPDILIVGSRITFAKPDKTIRSFVKKLGKKLKSPIPKAATFYTHMSPWKENVAQMGSFLKDTNTASKVLEDYLEFKIKDTGKMSGPPEPGQEPKINEFLNKLYDFIDF